MFYAPLSRSPEDFQTGIQKITDAAEADHLRYDILRYTLIAQWLEGMD